MTWVVTEIALNVIRKMKNDLAIDISNSPFLYEERYTKSPT